MSEVGGQDIDIDELKLVDELLEQKQVGIILIGLLVLYESFDNEVEQIEYLHNI